MPALRSLVSKSPKNVQLWYFVWKKSKVQEETARHRLYVFCEGLVVLLLFNYEGHIWNNLCILHPHNHTNVYRANTEFSTIGKKRMTRVSVCYLDFIPGLTSTTLSDTCTTRMVTSPDSGWLCRFRKSLTRVSRKLPNFVWGNPVWVASRAAHFILVSCVQHLSKEHKEKYLSDNGKKSSNGQYRCPKWGLFGHKDSIEYLHKEYKQMVDETDHIIYVHRMGDQSNKRKIVLLIP